MAVSAAAQFNIKVPKLGQPKPSPSPVSQPQRSAEASQPQAPMVNAASPVSAAAVNSPATSRYPKAGENPLLLKTTLDIRCDTENRYWKMPNESNYTSWVPQVRFKVLYAGATKLRLMVEYFNPDGSPWMSEMVKQNTANASEQTVELITDRVGDRFTNKSTVGTGLYGIKITDTRDGAVLFQGKFKVGKFKFGPNIPMFKNQHDFYVEQDWNMPIGYVWLNYGNDRNAPLPTASMWIKGETRLDDLEARLFYNGEQIATTDDMGEARSVQQRYPNSLENKETHRWELFDFAWYKFRYIATPQGGRMYANARKMNEMPGDYTVKVFHKGVQIREVSFKVEGGEFADTGYGSKNGFAESKVIVPVKIMGTKDKWNATQWKTDAFYGNPVSGFSAP
jgi:hypothetical protein